MQALLYSIRKHYRPDGCGIIADKIVNPGNQDHYCQFSGGGDMYIMKQKISLVIYNCSRTFHRKKYVRKDFVSPDDLQLCQSYVYQTPKPEDKYMQALLYTIHKHYRPDGHEITADNKIVNPAVKITTANSLVAGTFTL